MLIYHLGLVKKVNLWPTYQVDSVSPRSTKLKRLEQCDMTSERQNLQSQMFQGCQFLGNVKQQSRQPRMRTTTNPRQPHMRKQSKNCWGIYFPSPRYNAANRWPTAYRGVTVVRNWSLATCLWLQTAKKQTNTTDYDTIAHTCITCNYL
jgi:hypothetical protein